MGYFDKEYDSKTRFASYWHQIREILDLEPANILEVGIGNGLVSGYLRSRGLEVTTLDIREELSPDIVASVLDMPLEDGSFDVVACYEVLEHLEYGDFGTALSEIWRVCGRNAVISLPDRRGAARLLLKVPFFRERRWMFSFPRIRNRVPEEYHKWEIGVKGYPLRRIVSDLRKAGFSPARTYRVFENPNHMFFVLEKNAGKGRGGDGAAGRRSLRGGTGRRDAFPGGRT